MAAKRSSKKPPFVNLRLLKKIIAQKEAGRFDVLKTWCRSCTIIPQMVGVTLGVHNGRKHVPVAITENMIGKKLGEFAPTRTFHGHGADKTAKLTKKKAN